MTTMPFDTYEEPELAQGDKYTPGDYIGHTIIFKVLEYKPAVTTPNSKLDANGEKIPGPAIIVELVDLDGAEPTRVYRDVLWMGGRWVDGFKDRAPGGAKYTGRPNVVTIERRVSAKGRPYGVPMVADAAANQRAADHYAKHGDPFVPQFDTAPTGDADTGMPPF